MAILQPIDGQCECFIAGNLFPDLAGLGIISVNLRVNTEVTLTGNNIVLTGPTVGDLSVTAYAPLSGETLSCPGRAGASFNWDRRNECDSGGGIIVHFIPRGGVKAFREGAVTNKISITTINQSISVNASAASGPFTPVIYLNHYDGYNFSYTGVPISVSQIDSQQAKNLDIFDNIIEIPGTLYLQSFSWQYDPPNVPTVSYSFLFSFDG